MTRLSGSAALRRGLLSRTWFALVLVCAVVCSALSAASAPAASATRTAASSTSASDLDPSRIFATAETLEAIPERAQGEPGALQALELIEARLQRAGIATLRVRSTISVAADGRSELRAVAGTSAGTSSAIRLTPLFPNHAATPGTDGRPLTGPLLFAGRGSLEELRGRSVAGCIAVLDADSGRAWTTLAMLGAQAVVVRGLAPGSTAADRTDIAALSLPISAPFPRFAADLGDLTEGTQVTLRSIVRFEARAAWSVVGLIPGKLGTEQGIATAAADATSEMVMLAAGYEANGPLPTRGGTRAFNAGLLLDLAERLAAAPTRRSTLVVFHGGRAEDLRGLREIAGTLVSDPGTAPTGAGLSASGDGLLGELARSAVRRAWLAASLDGFLASLGREGYVSSAAAAAWERVLADPAQPPLAPTSGVDERRYPGRLIAIAAGEYADGLLAGLEPLRADYAAARSAKAPDAARLAELRRLLDQREPDYRDWRTLQQKLDSGKSLTAAEDARIVVIVPALRRGLERQQRVLADLREDFSSRIALRRFVGMRTAIHLIGFDLSDGGTRFATLTSGFHASFDHREKSIAALQSRHIPTLAAAIPGCAFDPLPWSQPENHLSWWDEQYEHEAGSAGHFLPAITVSTPGDSRLRVGMPGDALSLLRRDHLAAQCRGLLPLLRGWIDHAQLRSEGPLRPSQLTTVTVRAQTRAVGTKVGTRGLPFPHCFQQFGTRSDWRGDIAMRETHWGDITGEIVLPLVPMSFTDGKLSSSRVLSLYAYADTGGLIAAVADQGQHVSADSANLLLKTGRNQILERNLRPEVQPLRPSVLWQVWHPRLLTPLNHVVPLSASREAIPNLAHTEAFDGTAVIFSETGTPLRIIAQPEKQSKGANQLVLTGPRPQRRVGSNGDPGGLRPHAGHAASTAVLGSAAPNLWQNLGGFTPQQIAHDTLALNDERLRHLRQHGIDSDSLTLMQSRSERGLAVANAAIAAREWPQAMAAAQASWSYAGRAYPTVIATANDVVYGLVVLLFFAVPFALICERLLFAGSTIGRKVAGFAAAFTGVFLLFLLLHPGFAIATTPMIIFLAFAILLMASGVIALVVNRFELEMQRLRLAGLGAHSADVSRLGTLFATVGLGIANMRRRRLRTTLTVSTVALMTFILLTFSSAAPTLGERRLNLDDVPGHSGILVRHHGWSLLHDDVEPRLRRWSGERFTAVPVRWLPPQGARQRFSLSGPRGDATVQGVIGCAEGDPTGILRGLVRGPLDAPDSPRGFASVDAAGWIFLPAEVLTALGAEPGATVRFRGVELRAGLIDAEAMDAATHLGGDPVTPLSADNDTFRMGDETTSRLETIDATGTPTVESTSTVHLAPSTVCVVHASLCARLGGRLRAVHLVPADPTTDIQAAASELAPQLATSLRVASGGRCELVTSVATLALAGLGAVLVPLILGGLIIFSTMLNSVAERGREIFIYASLGLAPIHVAALFLVEASIYAVLGGLGGYLLAQIAIWLLGLAASYGLATQPDLNYSSFTAVATILAVMAVVLCSALWPAVVAARAASPGTTDFRLPNPDGDRIEVAFPFTVAARDAAGLLAFLRAWFALHDEASTGCFTAKLGVTDAAADAAPEVDATVWLAPFDLGLSQRFRLVAVPTDLPAIFALRLTLDLRSGQRAAWTRANVRFLRELRHQFLVWRTLTPDTQQRYRQLGGGAAVPATASPAAPPAPAVPA